jgi:hypothetical protein
MGDAALPFDGLTVPSKVEGHLDLFEQPGMKRVFSYPADDKSRPSVRLRRGRALHPTVVASAQSREKAEAAVPLLPLVRLVAKRSETKEE